MLRLKSAGGTAWFGLILKIPVGKAWLPALLKETRQGNSALKKSLSDRRGEGTGIVTDKILEELMASPSCIFFPLLATILPFRIHSQRFRNQRRGWDVGTQQYPRVQRL